MITVVLVCGGREYACDVKQRQHLWNTMDQIHAHYGDILVVHGGAKGADSYAGVWADAKGVHSAVVRALWHKYQLAAGPLRNAAMLALTPQVCVAFPGGKGTMGMVNMARNAGIPTYQV